MGFICWTGKAQLRSAQNYWSTNYFAFLMKFVREQGIRRHMTCCCNLFQWHSGVRVICNYTFIILLIAWDSILNISHVIIETGYCDNGQINNSQAPPWVLDTRTQSVYNLLIGLFFVVLCLLGSFVFVMDIVLLQANKLFHMFRSCEYGWEVIVCVILQNSFNHHGKQ